MKPVMNLDEVDFEDVKENGLYTPKRGFSGEKIGARQLGCNLAALPTRKAQRPFHSHRAGEEVFLILDGEGERRFGDRRSTLRRHDVIACPTGAPQVAHEIISTGGAGLRYLSLSTLAVVEVCEHPESGKLGLFAAGDAEAGLRRMFRAETAVDCDDREEGAAEATP